MVPITLDHINKLLFNCSSFETTPGVEVLNTFDGMGLRQDLMRGIYAYGFEKPSAIQQRAIKPMCKGRDVIAQ